MIFNLLYKIGLKYSWYNDLKKRRTKVIFILLLLPLVFIDCHLPSFVSKDNEKKEDLSITITARIFLPKDKSLDPEPLDQPFIDMESEAGIIFEEGWDIDAEGVEEGFDENLPQFKIDFDEELGNLYSEKAVTVYSVSEKSEMEVLAVLPTTRYGLLEFSVNQNYFDNNLLFLGLGNKENLKFHKLLSEPSSNILDIRSEVSFQLLNLLILPNFKNGVLTLTPSNKDILVKLNKDFEIALKAISLNTTNAASGSSLNFYRELFQKKVHPEIYEIIKENTILSDTEIDEKIKELFLKEKPVNPDQTDGTEISPAEDNEMKVILKEETLEKAPLDKNRWIVMEGKNFSFRMGNNNPTGEFEINEEDRAEILDWLSDQKPEHIVKLSPFKILKYEVSVGLFETCVKAGSCNHSGNGDKFDTYDKNQTDNPLNEITWENARNFCKWLGGDLPTEAQWEFAGRGRQNFLYVWGDNINWDIPFPAVNFNCLNTANCQEQVENTGEIGSFSDDMSDFGVYDMNGNVAEWVLDFYDPDFYSKAEATSKDPVNLLPGQFHSIRGSTFSDGFGFESFLTHRKNEEDYRIETGGIVGEIGFRCAARL